MAVDISDDVLICDEDANDVVIMMDVLMLTLMILVIKTTKLREFLRIMRVSVLKRLQQKF